jgi:hypothetical protein
MATEPKWIASSITVWGAAMAAAGAVWGFSADDVSQAGRYGQDALTLLGAIIAFIGRVRANRKATVLP